MAHFQEVVEERGEKEQENPRLLGALALAREGWPVFPVQHPVNGLCSCGKPDCASPAKHPLTRYGLKDAIRAEEQIRSWWQQTPAANIGLVTGKTSGAEQPGLVVLDVDPRHGGDTSLQTLIRAHGKLPYTRLVLTGGGGRHYYFQSIEDVRTTVRLAGLSGLDVRSRGGYVVAPPSRHLSGRLYRFARPNVPIAQAPEWLTALLRNSGNERSTVPLISKPTIPSDAVRLLSQAISQAIPGNRNLTGFTLACTLRNQGVPEWEAEAILRLYALKVPEGEHPYTIFEAVHSVRQAYKRS